MKKLFFLFVAGFLMLTFSDGLLAQSQLLRSKIRKDNSKETRFEGQNLNASRNALPGSRTKSIWDVYFSFDPTDQTSIPGWAGVVYAKGHFFCSKWNGADTLALFDSTGNFVDILTIPGIGAVRGMTFDGTYIYAGNNTRNVQVIDPVTYTRVRQHTVTTAVGNVRWITYNPSGNNGAGSFFVGNFGTAIFQVRKPPANTVAMATINSIAATVHGLTGMYGAAYEDNGANSKFWMFDQGQPESNAVIVQLNAEGIPTGVRRDVDLDAPAGGGGSAGGIFLADMADYPGKTLICLNQGSGVVGYDIRLPNFDALFDSLAPANGLTAWPKNWYPGTKLQGKVRANGTTTLANFSPSIEVMNATTLEPVQNLQVLPLTIAGGQTQSFVTAEVVPGFYTTDELYMAQGVTNYPGDQIASNDTAFTFFGLTDTTIAQDFVYFDRTLSSQIGIGASASDEKSLGARFNLPVADTLTSVSYYLAAPFAGESSSVSIYPVTNGIPSTTAITTTTQVYTATEADFQNGVTVTIRLDNPIPLPAGDFLVAVNELGDSIASLGSINFNFKPNTFFVKWNSAPSSGVWVDLTAFPGGLQRAFAIYPNFGKLPAVTTVLPVCSTATISDITLTGATVNSTVQSDGGSAISARGVCWSTSPNPTIALSTKTSDGSGTGDFISNVTGLTANTTYYLRAYATNSNGTSYGNESFFTTLSTNTLATISTNNAVSLTTTSATAGGNISADGGATVTARGVCWSSSSNPTINLSTKTFDGSGNGTFTSTITGLTPNATYYIRAYAQNSVGVAYGNEVVFVATAPVSLATLSTTPVTALTTNSASSGGNITADGGGTITARGVCWSTSPAPTTALTTKTVDGSGTGSFTSNITGLNPSTTYFIRAYAENSAGVAYGSELSFTTDVTGVLNTLGGEKGIRFILSPNPASEVLQLAISSERGGMASIRISDLTGKEVHSLDQDLFPGEFQVQIPVENLPDGLYFAEILLDGKSVIQKFRKN